MPLYLSLLSAPTGAQAGLESVSSVAFKNDDRVS
jgi:hypothetical protein